ncbi:23S rRNA (uracil747-C5)-methyltransferase [Arcanobacterium wilhelmae]|uniref:23S rRNA (Uracil747-C5)-methyltransferase n=1 Tax=Arcanobacterium wilhelmae TaxID=1803177 RepID=A0ABT9NAP2_9ACTO|nr:hypothetical protein [Arcanobacterium wilhelmae]MDP9800802.1 23S rRNA (uracil747-C5)-methyltransferase [Arcanobacterium wilhelmae]WFN90178.1 hypothetical protein P8A24_08335 [Arcanobacterium wilhelmae]
MRTDLTRGPIRRAAVPTDELTRLQLLDCAYYRDGLCRSCSWIEQPLGAQLQAKDARARTLIDAAEWLEPVASAKEAFRNKVKLVVTGSARLPKLGILGPDGTGVDLADCPLPSAGIRTAIEPIRAFITRAGLEPYSPASDTGALKYVILEEAPTGELMVRFVARRRGVQGILFKLRAELEAALPNMTVLSLNVQPERKAIIEGAEEILISENGTLPMRLWVGEQWAEHPVELALRPRSFFQTNTDIAEALYTRAVQWLSGVESAWDLYCGVGGFLLALAAAAKRAGTPFNGIGVETSEEAVASGAAGAAALGMSESVRFVTADAGAWVREVSAASRANAEKSEPNAPTARSRGNNENRASASSGTPTSLPEAVVVNPPRRGIGELANWLEGSGVGRVLYSSCNVDTLAKDLAAMPSYRVAKAQVLDMFPHTPHFETIVLLERVV